MLGQRRAYLSFRLAVAGIRHNVVASLFDRDEDPRVCFIQGIPGLCHGVDDGFSARFSRASGEEGHGKGQYDGAVEPGIS